MTARVGIGVAAAAVVVAVALAAGAPAFAERQADRFLEPVMITDGADPRQRLTKVTSNGRVDHWKVSLRTFRDDPLKGSGAGTYQNAWNRWRELNFQVLDSHSLYLETLGELGLVGLGLLAVAMITLLVGLAWRLRGPGRVDVAAVLAATAAWAVHAGVDWDWELTAVSAWLFGLCGLAFARRPVEATNLGPARLVRVVAALGCLVLALLPAAVWRSQVRLQEAADAFRRGDCPATIDAGLNSLDALGARAEPWELIAYCNVRLGQPVLAEGAARAAIARDPDNWEYHYALAIVRGVFGKDPRPAAAAALRLNPLEERTTQASRAFRTSRPRLWERRARRLPLYLR